MPEAQEAYKQYGACISVAHVCMLGLECPNLSLAQLN